MFFIFGFSGILETILVKHIFFPTFLKIVKDPRPPGLSRKITQIVCQSVPGSILAPGRRKDGDQLRPAVG